MEKINLLVIGQGGREHTLAWKLAQSPRAARVWVAPGNGGTARNAQPGTAPIANIAIAENNVDDLIAFARQNEVGLTVVGPEAPLAAGLADAFQTAGLRCFGPRQAAARLEASKAFAKAFMERRDIPTGRYATFTAYDAAQRFLQQVDYPVVVKASGLAAGKGVIVPNSAEAAEAALRQIMTERAFGAAGDEVVIEERLFGQEASVLALCDGHSVAPLPPAQDHKPIFNGDRGPNTGGMGAYAPAPLVTATLLDAVVRTVLQPAVDGLRAEGAPYVGVLYAGLMINETGAYVLEFNCRFGDPEAQVVLPLLESDLVEAIEACLEGRLDRVDLRWRSEAAVTVVAASAGYPGNYPKGRDISGLAEANARPGVTVFHAGTRQTDDGRLVTNGGRVLAVTALGPDLPQAIDRAYAGMQAIHFDGMQFRTDIGAKALGPAG
jgi:phosphoribosylamine--glycine ligase